MPRRINFYTVLSRTVDDKMSQQATAVSWKSVNLLGSRLVHRENGMAVYTCNFVRIRVRTLYTLQNKPQ